MTQGFESAESIHAETWFVAGTGGGTVRYALGELALAIRSGAVSGRTLVWRQGMLEWAALDQIPLLRTIAARVLEPQEPEELTRVMQRPAPNRVSLSPSFARQPATIAQLARRAPPKPAPSARPLAPVSSSKAPVIAPATVKPSLKPVTLLPSIIVAEPPATARPEPTSGKCLTHSPVVAAAPSVRSCEPVASIHPSVTTIDIEMPEWRNPRRPLVLASAAVFAVGIAVFVSLGAAPKSSARSRRVLEQIGSVTGTNSAQVVPAAPATVPGLENNPAPVATPVEMSAPPTAAPKRDVVKRPAASPRRELPSVDSQFVEAPRSTTPSAAKLRERAAAALSWDQGPVERRVWMSPAF